MDEAILDLLRRQHGVITRQQASDAGLSRRQIGRRLDTGEWISEGRAIYRHKMYAPTWRERLLVACLRHGGLASHRSAAVLHGIEDYRPGAAEVTVALNRWRNPAGVRLHQSTQMDRADPTKIDAIPCTGLSRTVLDLAAVVSRHRLEHTIDAVIRDHGLDLAALYETLVRHSRRGRDGCGRLRTVLDSRMGDDTVPLSRWSRMVRDLLIDNGLPTPAFEFEVHDIGGRFLAKVDLAYPAARIAIELDSVRYHLNRASFERDAARRNRAVVAGWAVVNFTWTRYVNDPLGICAEVRELLRPNSGREKHRFGV